MQVGDLVMCDYGSVSGVALVIKGGKHAVFLQPVLLASPIWVSRGYVEAINESR